MRRAYWGRDSHWRGRHDNGQHRGWDKHHGDHDHGHHGDNDHHH